jgi:RHS repeat-associated protein
VSYPYSESRLYSAIGNITAKDGVSYTYSPTKPHQLTQVGSNSYSYDNNGNMTSRWGETLTWDVENHLSSVGSRTYVYDGNGQRVKKTESGTTTIYVNRFYEKNLTSGEITTYYYFRERLVALRKGSTLEYVHQDHLNSTVLSTDSAGGQKSVLGYLPFGQTRMSQGALGTDQKFTGQRQDSNQFYYYGARYYDAGVGRFLSPDSIIPDLGNPQALNRYSYVYNNPLRYTDPSGHAAIRVGTEINTGQNVFAPHQPRLHQPTVAVGEPYSFRLEEMCQTAYQWRAAILLHLKARPVSPSSRELR